MSGEYPMSEEKIERRVERMTDALDRVLMSGGLSQAEYDKAIKDLDRWAEGQLARRIRA